ncbi:hypothetical protein [Streptomyces sp. ATCC 21386]|nr:hypothetical protein [Streptomyces sp. ATCC 21386]
MEWWSWLVIGLAILAVVAALGVALRVRSRSGGVIAQGRRPPGGEEQKP